jgi:hypothetical protein
MGLDTNDVAFVDRVFLRKEDADEYVRSSNRADRALVFYSREQVLCGYSEQPTVL